LRPDGGGSVRTRTGKPRPRVAAPSGRPWLAHLLLLLVAGVAAAQSLEVIELRYRLAGEVIPVLQPLVEPGGVLTGEGRHLFVRSSPANLAQLRAAIDALDRPPRQLVITVGQETTAAGAESRVRGSVSVQGGDVGVGVNAPPGAGTGAAVGASSRQQDERFGNVSSVRVLEGSETWIAVGQIVPITTTQLRPGWRGPVVTTETVQRNVSTGFFATPRVSGDRVRLEISPRQQRVSGSGWGTTVETAGVATTVEGRIGEWLPLGAVQDSTDGRTGGLLVWGQRSSESQYAAWVRVAEVP
jgi:type II secretory pathway component GspD/PulD (secretin)